MKRMAHLSSGSSFTHRPPLHHQRGSGPAGAVDLQVVADVQGQSLDMIIGMNIIPGRLAQPLKEKETAVRKECSDVECAKH